MHGPHKQRAGCRRRARPIEICVSFLIEFLTKDGVKRLPEPSFMLIPSGSLTAGISPVDFHLPPNTALRYERPSPAISRHVTAYIVMDSAVGTVADEEWMLPTWAQIWIAMTAEAIDVSVGNRRYGPLPPAMLYGVTSRAMSITARGGVTIGIELSPLGWARLVGQSAEMLRDRVTPLGTVVPPDLVAQLSAALLASDLALGVKEALDDVFLRHLTTPHPDEPKIDRVLSLIHDEGAIDLTSAAIAHGIDAVSASRIARSYFGFPAKILMMRTRFLRAFVPLLDGDTQGAVIPPGYHDQSHFIRDGKRFLGMTPRQFIARRTPYAAAARKARQLVIGTPIPPLDRL
jgi:hypothetical protein